MRRTMFILSTTALAALGIGLAAGCESSGQHNNGEYGTTAGGNGSFDTNPDRPGSHQDDSSMGNNNVNSQNGNGSTTGSGGGNGM